jgi:nucleoside-diphosphate-sugar epimerase
MKALVTGGGGFLGRYIVRELLRKDYEVRIFTRKKYPELEEIGAIQFCGSLEDAEAVNNAVKGVDVVYHVAAKAGVWGRYEDYYMANVVGTENVLSACLRNQVKKLIYTSSPSVVFDGTDMQGVDESVPYSSHYETHYPKTKAMGEKKVLEANGKDGLLTCALRPHLIWGPEDNHLIPRFIKRAKAGAIRIVGTGQNLVDAVYVENAARAHILAEEKLEEGSSVCGSAYFVTNHEPVRLFGWINKFVEAAEMPPVEKKIPTKVAWFAGLILEKVHGLFGLSGEPRMTRFLARELSTHHWFDTTKQKQELGFEPKISMEEGYKRTFESEWFQNLVKEL